MKTLKKIMLVLCALATPVVAFAQTSAPVTRAQVEADLARLESVGYNPFDGGANDYPAPLFRAERKLAALDVQRAAAQATSGAAVASVTR